MSSNNEEVSYPKEDHHRNFQQYSVDIYFQLLITVITYYEKIDSQLNMLNLIATLLYTLVNLSPQLFITFMDA